jgi:hypothetical protein
VADKGHSRTKSEITPQYHETRQQMRDSRHNFTIHATIPRFTPQFHDSRHNFTIHATKKPLINHGLNKLMKFIISRLFPQQHDTDDSMK